MVRGAVLVTAVLWAGGASQTAHAQVTAYMEIQGVRGDASEAGHETWVTIESFQHAISGAPGPISTGGSGGRSQGRASVGEVSIVKKLDKSTPSLLDACSQGARFEEVTLHVVDAGGGKHLVYTFERVGVIRYRITCAGDSSLRRYIGVSVLDRSSRVEEVTFGYGRVTWSDDEEDDGEDDWRR